MGFLSNTRQLLSGSTRKIRFSCCIFFGLLPVKDEDGRYAVLLPDGLTKDYKEKYDYIVTFQFEPYQGDLRDRAVQSGVSQALNSKRYPNSSAEEIIQGLSRCDDLKEFQQLAATIKASRLDVHDSRLLFGLDAEQQRMLELAYYNGSVQNDPEYWDSALTLRPQQGNPVELLACARIQAWGNSRETTSILSSFIESATLSDDERIHIADTLQILYLDGIEANETDIEYQP